MKRTRSCFTLFFFAIGYHSVYSIVNEYISIRSQKLRNIFEPYTTFSTSNVFYENTTTAVTETITIKPFAKKWQVGRISRKQYEIVNMLWRKTKIFIDIETSTIKYQLSKNHTRNRSEQKFTTAFNLPRLRPSTASYIEFYYLEENDVRVKNNGSLISGLRSQNKPSILMIENGPNFQPLTDFPLFTSQESIVSSNETPRPLAFLKSTKLIRRENPQMENLPFLRFKSTRKISNKYSQKPPNNKYDSHLVEYLRKHFLKNDISYDYKLETCPLRTSTRLHMSDYENTNSIDHSRFSNDLKNDVEAQTTYAYDKIKFFEIFDRNTEGEQPFITKHINDNEKVLLRHVNNDSLPYHGSRNTRYANNNKLGQDDKLKLITIQSMKNTLTAKKLRNVTTERKLDSTKYNLKRGQYVHKLCNRTKCLFSNLSRIAEWSDYTFAAVYVYEPSKVRCDAAGISPHWLVAAASCLSRHHLDYLSSEVLSAFVTFCGNSWQQPERVAYVELRLIHPRYHPNNTSRRYIYNIGLVKVVSSMASGCSRWAPISLMSHQYTTNDRGSWATAVGWGVDRYVSKNRSQEALPGFLYVYEGLIHSNACPGNNGYRKAKDSNKNTVKYMYCLSLPPYLGEKFDPVHGSLLLVEGKLVALYLQEERRPWGEQSAQYVGFWRLIPWIHSVAREPEVDGFTAVI